MQPPTQDYGSNALAASLTFAVAIAVFTLGGWWLDTLLGTRFVFLLVGFVLGAAGGMLHLLSRVAPDLLPFGRRRRPPPGSADPPATP